MSDTSEVDSDCSEVSFESDDEPEINSEEDDIISGDDEDESVSPSGTRKYVAKNGKYTDVLINDGEDDGRICKKRVYLKMRADHISIQS